MSETHISLDIEACGEVLMSIGLCSFDIETGNILSELYVVFPIQEQLNAGLKMEEGAFLWWLDQDKSAREAITKNQPKLPDDMKAQLAKVRKWWPEFDAFTWAYPTSYDLPIVERAFKTFGMKPPWKWTKTMDARTLWQLAMKREPGIEKVEAENPVPHHALEDAKEQARWISRYMKSVIT